MRYHGISYTIIIPSPQVILALQSLLLGPPFSFSNQTLDFTHDTAGANEKHQSLYLLSGVLWPAFGCLSARAASSNSQKLSILSTHNQYEEQSRSLIFILFWIDPHCPRRCRNNLRNRAVATINFFLELHTAFAFQADSVVSVTSCCIGLRKPLRWVVIPRAHGGMVLSATEGARSEQRRCFARRNGWCGEQRAGITKPRHSRLGRNKDRMAILLPRLAL
jgi:hypothetical protein